LKGAAAAAPFSLPPPGKCFESEIGEANFGRAAAWAEWISDPTAHRKNTKGPRKRPLFHVRLSQVSL
jgi:hypothetical protein